MLRLASALLALPAALLATGPAIPGAGHALGDVAAHEIAAAKPGTILRVWPQIGGGEENAKAYRVLYRSTGLNGEPIAVSGAVLIPATPAPRGKRGMSSV